MRALSAALLILLLGTGADAAPTPAQAAKRAGRHAEAARLLQARARRLSGAAKERIIVTTAVWAAEVANAGNYRAARDYLQAAVHMRSSQAGVRLKLAANLGNVFAVLGSYEEAEHVLRDAYRASAGADLAPLRAEVCLNWGALHYMRRRYAQAGPKLDEAVRIARARGLTSIEAGAEMVRGMILRQQREYGRARRTYERALEKHRAALRTSKEAHVREQLAMNVRNLGELYQAMAMVTPDEARRRELLRSARVHVGRSLSLAREMNAARHIAAAISHLAEIDEQLGNVAKAESEFKDAISRFEAIHFKDGIGRCAYLVARMYEDQGRWAEARAHYDKAALHYGDLEDREWLRLAWAGLGRCAEQAGDSDAAEAHYVRAADAVQALSMDLTSTTDLLARETDRLYERMIPLLVQRGKLELALRYAGRSWSEQVQRTGRQAAGGAEIKQRGDVQARFVALAKHIDSLAAAGRLSAKEARATRETLAALRERLNELQFRQEQARGAKEIGRINADMIRTRSEFNALVSKLEIGKIDLHPERLLKMIRGAEFPDDHAIVVYWVAENEIFAFVGKRDAVWPARIPLGVKEVSQRVDAFRQRILRDHYDSLSAKQRDQSARRSLRKRVKTVPGDLPPFHAQATALYDLLVRPLEAKLVDAKTVGLIPMGPLASLPFHALVRREGDVARYWIEDRNVVYLSYLNAEHTLGGRGNQSPLGKNADVVVFANPDGSLPFAESEGHAIRSHFPETQLFTRKDASKRAFLDRWRRADVVHVAAHAVFADRSAGVSSSYIQLGASRLTEEEIRRLPASEKAKLIVLSACSTSRADLAASATGTHLETLASAFAAQQQELGHRVIATLWDVEDDSTAAFMNRFYAEIRKGGSPTAALRRAQLFMLRGDPADDTWSERYRHAHHWAPFVFVGAWD